MSEITQRLPPVVASNPVHPNAKTTTHITNGTTTTKTNITSPVCRNCKTQTTPLWRRDETGQVLCNACGLFLKLHGRPRPISLKTDTIKSRNRIKQPNSAKSSSPNTPELKSKDCNTPISSGKVLNITGAPTSGKKSPKTQKTKSKNEQLTPLLPATSGAGPAAGGAAPGAPGSAAAAKGNGQVGTPQFTPHVLPHLSHIHSTPHVGGLSGISNGPFHHNSTLPHHLSHQVQPLHYPSSTPTQFAPGLQRITSPLLLSNTSSISNARSSNSASKPSGPLSAAAQAAGALETMSNELGPSASFKVSNGSLGIGRKDVSLINQTVSNPSEQTKVKMEYSTPSSALNAGQPPKLPSLTSASATPVTSAANGSGISSPSFGPQFSLQHQQDAHYQSSQGTPEVRPTSLPPIVGHSPNTSSHLPHLQNNFAHNKSFEAKDGETSGSHSNSSSNNSGNTNTNSNNSNNNNNNNSGNNGSNSGNSYDPTSNAGSGSNSGNSGNSNSQSGSGPGGDRSNEGGDSTHTITILKTRISELELVNDLYRTRIMELEAMEQASRLREISMRKRLDEIISLQEGQSNVPAKSHEPSHRQADPFRASQQATPASSQPSFGRYALPPIHQAVDSVKREYEGSSGADGSAKKLRVDN